MRSEDYNLSSQKIVLLPWYETEGCFKEFVSFITDEGEKDMTVHLFMPLLKKEFKST